MLQKGPEGSKTNKGLTNSRTHYTNQYKKFWYGVSSEISNNYHLLTCFSCGKIRILRDWNPDIFFKISALTR